MHHLSWPARTPASGWSRTARPWIDSSGSRSGAGWLSGAAAPRCWQT